MTSWVRSLWLPGFVGIAVATVVWLNARPKPYAHIDLPGAHAVYPSDDCRTIAVKSLNNAFVELLHVWHGRENRLRIIANNARDVSYVELSRTGNTITVTRESYAEEFVFNTRSGGIESRRSVVEDDIMTAVRVVSNVLAQYGLPTSTYLITRPERFSAVEHKGNVEVRGRKTKEVFCRLSASTLDKRGGVCVSSDGKQFVGRLKCVGVLALWQADSDSTPRVIPGSSRAKCLSLSLDGKSAVVIDEVDAPWLCRMFGGGTLRKEVRVIETATGRVVAHLPEARSAEFSSDGDTLIVIQEGVSLFAYPLGTPLPKVVLSFLVCFSATSLLVSFVKAPRRRANGM